ncbi:histidine kinase [uncultured Kordia sp.]|uniref:sensor histidine kinase n=1 Tax=uncultured Kordia sp. TaxID=507699 RepID=UPI00260823A3|nr:histidine kinase [uncultured Kordia sp.]
MKLKFALLFLCLLYDVALVFSQTPYYVNYNTESGLPSSQTYHSFEDNLGYLWFSSDRGIVKYDGYTFTTYTTKEGLANLVNFEFYQGTHNTFWVNGYDGSFSFWDGKQFSPFAYNWKIKQYKKNAGWFNIINVTDTTISFIRNFENGLPENYYVINIETGEIQQLPLTLKTYIGNRYINNLIVNKLSQRKKINPDILDEVVDLNGNFWRFTRSKGALFYEKGDTTQQAKIYFKDIPISSLYQNAQGNYWFTTLDRGILYMPSLHIKKLNISSNSDLGYQELKVFDDILIAELSEKNKALYYKDEVNFFFSNLKISKVKKQRISDLLGKKIARSNFDSYLHHTLKISDRKYVRYWGNGLLMYSYKHDNLHLDFEFESRPLCVAKDNAQGLWVGTIDGLYKINFKNKAYKTTRIPLLRKDSIPTRVNDILNDKKGLWLATLTKGLLYKTTDSIFQIQHKKLEGKALQCLYKQNDSILWIGTNKGLCKLTYTSKNATREITNVDSFTTQDGLHSNSINDILFWDQNMYLATSNGINFFDPDKLIKYNNAPKITINQFFVNGQLTDSLKSRYELKHNENSVKITFTGLTLNKPVEPESFYRYRLNDGLWNYTNNRSIEYHFLPSNSYQLVLQCQNNNGIWSAPKKIQFQISPHFSELLSFRIALIGFILGTLIILIRMRIKATNKKINKELLYKESELATLRNQMNPHFVFNSLNTLQGYIFEGDAIAANTYIGDFASLIRKSLEFSKKSNISLKEELEFIENYLVLESHRFEDKFEFEIETDIDDTTIQIVPLMVQPIVENAAKHAFKSNTEEKGKILIKYLYHTKSSVLIEIIDNGCGFDAEKLKSVKGKHKSMGIQIIKQRIDLINDKLRSNIASFKSVDVTKGTRIQLILPIL